MIHIAVEILILYVGMPDTLTRHPKCRFTDFGNQYIWKDRIGIFPVLLPVPLSGEMPTFP